jgi:hypothetical protein
MNERIFELAKQAGFIEEDGGNNLHVFDGYEAITCTEELKKFAELIVGECYETIKKDMELAHIQLIPIDFGIYANGRLRRIIKEHFGVE